MTRTDNKIYNKVTCGIFQIYFYDNLFNPNKIFKYKIKNDLTKEQ